MSERKTPTTNQLPTTTTTTKELINYYHYNVETKYGVILFAG